MFTALIQCRNINANQHHVNHKFQIHRKHKNDHKHGPLSHDFYLFYCYFQFVCSTNENTRAIVKVFYVRKFRMGFSMESGFRFE